MVCVWGIESWFSTTLLFQDWFFRSIDSFLYLRFSSLIVCVRSVSVFILCICRSKIKYILHKWIFAINLWNPNFFYQMCMKKYAEYNQKYILDIFVFGRFFRLSFSKKYRKISIAYWLLCACKANVNRNKLFFMWSCVTISQRSFTQRCGVLLFSSVSVFKACVGNIATVTRILL